MANEQRLKAQRLAASGGASIQQIKQKTGLSGSAARVVLNTHSPARPSAPSSSQAAASTPAPYRAASNRDNKQYGGDINNALQYTRGNSATLGIGALDRARQGGMTDQQLRDAAFYGSFQMGQGAYDQLFGGGQRASNTMVGKTFRTTSGIPVNVSGKDISYITPEYLGNRFDAVQNGRPEDVARMNGQASQAQANAAASTTQTKTGGYKNIKSIRQGLAIGANSTISNKEARRIAKNTGRSYDQVLTKGLELGFDVSAKAANKSNKRYNSSLPMQVAPDSFYGQLLASKDPLAAMRNQKVNKGYSYQGVAVKDGPGIFGRKNAGGMNPLTIKKPGDTTNTNSTTTTTTTGGGTGTTGEEVTTPVEQVPVTPEEKMPLGPGGLTGGGAVFSGAAGLRRKKSYLRSLGIRGMGQLGRSQINNMYKQTVNLNR